MGPLIPQLRPTAAAGKLSSSLSPLTHPARHQGLARSLWTRPSRSFTRNGARIHSGLHRCTTRQQPSCRYMSQTVVRQRQEVDTTIRNPLDYVNNKHKIEQRMTILKKRIAYCCAAIAVIVGVQTYLFFTREEETSSSREADTLARVTGQRTKDTSWVSAEKLDAAPGASEPGQVVVAQAKPGQPEIKLDEHGIELVPTGTSSIPHFPRTILLPATDADPSATPPDARPGEEEYYLLGLGVRTVSWFGVEVYVLGLYVRTSDLPALQLAFVKHVNPIGTSLISTEKDKLKQALLDDAGSVEIWDKVLRETGVRSAVRIVPTRGTDFGHLRDGWVRGITNRTQAAAKRGSKEYDDEAFGASVGQFKALFGGKGKAPVGSIMLLTRDERGRLAVFYLDKKTTAASPGSSAAAASGLAMGAVADERLSRLVWLGYLAGKNVSSEPARRSVVDGVIELVERPVGTVGLAVT